MIPRWLPISAAGFAALDALRFVWHIVRRALEIIGYAGIPDALRTLQGWMTDLPSFLPGAVAFALFVASVTLGFKPNLLRSLTDQYGFVSLPEAARKVYEETREADYWGERPNTKLPFHARMIVVCASRGELPLFGCPYPSSKREPLPQNIHQSNLTDDLATIRVHDSQYIRLAVHKRDLIKHIKRVKEASIKQPRF